MSKLISLIVGSHFAPPAKLFLEHLPSGAPLLLRREPDNPYDPNAILVFVDPAEVPLSQRDELNLKLPGAGFDLMEMLVSKELVQLGHVAASGGKPILKASATTPGLVGTVEFLAAMQDEVEVPAKLGFDGGGLVLVVLDTLALLMDAVRDNDMARMGE